MGAKTVIGYGCFLLFLTPFCGVGIFMTVRGLQAAMTGDWGEAGPSLLFGLLFGGVGFGLLAALFYGRKKQQELERLQGEHPAEPWLWRFDWVRQHTRHPYSRRGARLLRSAPTDPPRASPQHR
jgi:hypothetical protein